MSFHETVGVGCWKDYVARTCLLVFFLKIAGREDVVIILWKKAAREVVRHNYKVLLIKNASETICLEGICVHVC